LVGRVGERLDVGGGRRLADWSAVRTIALGIVGTLVLLMVFTVTKRMNIPVTITSFLIAFFVVGLHAWLSSCS
jgi:hypothetical protein